MSQSLVFQSLQSCHAVAVNSHVTSVIHQVSGRKNLFLILHLTCCCQKEMLQLACLCQKPQYFAQTTIAFGMRIPNVLLCFHGNRCGDAKSTNSWCTHLATSSQNPNGPFGTTSKFHAKWRANWRSHQHAK